MTKNRIFHSILLAAAVQAAVSLSSPAHAQEVTAAPVKGTDFDRTRTVPILSRIPPGYEKNPIRIGSFVASPRIEVDLSVIDNAYARPSDKQSNVGALIAPSVNIISDWSRHQLGLTADATILRSFTISSENYTAYTVRASGRYDISQALFVYGSVTRRRLAELRTDPGAITNTVAPVISNVTEGTGRVTWSPGRLRLLAETKYTDIRFDDFKFASGVQPAIGLNRTLWSVTGRADYAITPDLALVGVARRTHQKFLDVAAVPQLDRTGNKTELQAGASFELPDLIRGEVTLGYIDVSYNSPLFQKISGFGGRASVEYFASRLTSFRLNAARTVEESGNPQFPQYVRSSVNLSVDHELYRDFVISAAAGYMHNRYYNPDRTQNRPTATLSARWMINSRMSLAGRYDYVHVDTKPSGLGNNFSVNSVVLGLTLQL